MEAWRSPGLTLFHGSAVEFDRPHPLTHFGTRRAAEAAPRSNGVIMTFSVTIENALQVSDTPGGGDLYEWIASALLQGVVSYEEFDGWTRIPTAENFITLVSSKGYDGIVYENLFEDPGSLSWVVFDSWQAFRVKPSPEIESESLLPEGRSYI